MKQDKLLTFGFALFSIITAFIFVLYAVNIIFGSEASKWLKTFSYVVGGYGLFHTYILSWAWRTQADWAPKADLTIAACLLGVFTMDTVRDGIADPVTEAGGIIGLAAVLAINWYAVKKLSERDAA